MGKSENVYDTYCISQSMFLYYYPLFSNIRIMEPDKHFIKSQAHVFIDPLAVLYRMINKTHAEQNTARKWRDSIPFLFVAFASKMCFTVMTDNVALVMYYK